MKDTFSSVAVIILNWNGYNDTFECIKSLESLDYNNFHVFLVDNASTDDSYEKLMSDIESNTFQVNITCIQSGANLGCAGGNNVAIKEAFEAGYDYYWMLNNDTIVDPKALSTLVEVIDGDPKIGIVGSKVYFAGTNLLWYAGGDVNPYTGNSWQFGYCEEDKGQYDEIKEVNFIAGCSMLFRKKLIEENGLLEEDYFLMYEDTDWNVKAKKGGWKLVYTPHSIIHHKESSSTKAEDLSPYYSYYLIRNGYLMAKRINPKFKWLAFINLFVRLAKFHIIFVYRSKTNRKIRSILLFEGVIHALKQRTGQYIRGVSHARKREYM